MIMYKERKDENEKKKTVKGINGENNFTIQRNSDMTFTLVDVNKDGIPEL